MKKLSLKWAQFLKILGPGVITGAADDDPSGIATYSQTGAQFGYGQLWTSLFILPLLTAVQEACARLGAVTGKGLAANIRDHYPKPILRFVVLLTVIANTINIGADLGAMSAALQLLLPVNYFIATTAFAVFIVLIEIVVSYRTYSRILKWLAFALLAYPVSVFMIHQPWSEILRATVIPRIDFSPSFLFIITGVIGTTISPYMFFWQTSEEVEEQKLAHVKKKNGLSVISSKVMKNIQLDTFIGMVFSQFTSWCIIVLAGTVFFQNQIFSIETAADAARALEPLVQSFPNAGYVAKLIFAVGIIGLGLLAVPVLSGSAAYAVAETFSWKEGLNKKLHRALGFYGVIIASTGIGMFINYLGINPMKALIFTAVFNAITSIPLLLLIAQLTANRKIMGSYTSGFLSQILLRLTFIGVSVAGILMLLSIEFDGFSLLKLLGF